MAEAHSAVAFGFHVTHEGVHFSYDSELLNLILHSGVRSYKRSFYRFINNVKCGVFPGGLPTLMLSLGTYNGIYFSRGLAAPYTHHVDPSFGAIDYIRRHVSLEGAPGDALAVCVFGTCVWLGLSLSLKYSLKALFMYKGFMYEARGRGAKVSMASKLWFYAVTGLSKLCSPMLYSFQGALPALPLPGLKDTTRRYLRSVRPLLDDKQYAEMEHLCKDFEKGLGPRLQFFLHLKRMFSTNYVSDWWEEYVYLRGRSPIMVNSNFYGTDAIIVHPTFVQAARAANVCHAAFVFRRQIDRQTLNPIQIYGAVPLCSSQYERAFNTTRIPGVECDKIVHFGDSTHVVVMHKGRFFKMPCYYKGSLMTARELQNQIEMILADTTEPDSGEALLGALTAGERRPWAEARERFMTNGVNRASLEAIERAAFVLCLESQEAPPFNGDEGTRLDAFASTMLHGTGADRWYDKSFNVIVMTNGRIGFNAEHSWGDAAISSHFWEHIMTTDLCDTDKYDETGNCAGAARPMVLRPTKLRWNISSECNAVIQASYKTATTLIADIDMRLIMFRDFGKGLMKKVRTSPDAFIQLSLQLAYYRDAGRFNLTYEASMTRLFRDGRTETVRPCTIESADFVLAMLDENKTREERVALFKAACLQHQRGYQDAMCGKGVDRHLFCLYVVSRYLEKDSPFLQKVLQEPWRLSTSQTPHGQTDKLNLTKHPNLISAGGGFGPVASDGYGVSYIVAGEDTLFFHVSSRKSCAGTDSHRFSERISTALRDVKELLQG